MIELANVHTYYGETCVLRGISLEVKKGSVVALLGRNGMGKTTTIRSIIGFTPPRSGTVQFKGKNIMGLQPDQIARMGMGLVPQGRRIFPSLSVEENLTVSAQNRGEAKGWSLDKVYSLFPILKERARCKGNLLSGGEQQMLSIGRALMTNPDFVLMDEPSEGLAPVIVGEIGHIIYELKKDGLSILLVEQNLPLALTVADYVYIISKGLIAYESTPDELRGNEQLQAVHLGVTVKRSEPPRAHALG